MKKVTEAGIGGKLGEWIENWLVNREQRVMVNESNSDWADVLSGVPQGSILGPLLFTIYINDLENNLNNSLTNFADDSKLLEKINTPAEVSKMQNDLKTLENWSTKNSMPFNVSKCKVMHLGKKNTRQEYILNEVRITKTKDEKDLGVFFLQIVKTFTKL